MKLILPTLLTISIVCCSSRVKADELPESPRYPQIPIVEASPTGEKCFGFDDYQQLVHLELWAYGLYADNMAYQEKLAKMELKLNVARAREVVAQVEREDNKASQAELEKARKEKRIWRVLAAVGGVLALGAGTVAVFK